MNNTNFTLKVFATNWGFQGNTEEFCAKAKKEGYDGIEIWYPMEISGQDELFNILAKYSLDVGFLCGSLHSGYDDNFKEFSAMVNAAAANTIKQPLYINCHSGKDYFTYEQNKSFIDHTVEASKTSGIKICHETHRSRILYAAPIGRYFMENNPALRITLDASHWCNVSESLLQEQTETMKMAIERTDHIHARIGHEEGPQVSDPRAPEWQNALNAHLAWWDSVVELKKKQGDTLTFLTEFGPPNYMPVLAYTGQPLSDQWAINVHMMHLLRNRYARV
jgi:sugar phosphate isomerase/epimerase